MPADPDPKVRLLLAAAELFARDGYAGVTVRAVASQVGMNVAAVSYHFGGKEGVYGAAVELACREMETASRSPDSQAAWWAKLLGQELLRDGPRAPEVAETIRRVARRSEAATCPVETGPTLLAVAGLMAVAASTRPDGTRDEAVAAWAALDHARSELLNATLNRSPVMTETELHDVARRVEARSGLSDEGCEPVVVLAHADPAVRAQMDRYLTVRGFQVLAAGTATEVMWEGLSHAGSVDTLLCDPHLPGLPVAELYRRLRVTLPWLHLCLLAPSPV